MSSNSANARWMPLAAVLALGLAACEGPARTGGTGGNATGDVAEREQVAQVEKAEPAAGDGPAGTQAPGPTTITFEGFGRVPFGAGPGQLREAWAAGGEGTLEAVPPEPAACYYLMPQPLPPGGYRTAFMIEGGEFRRIDVKADDVTAPGGGRTGLTAAEIESLYPGRIETRPHKYVEGGKYLRIVDGRGGDGVLIFDVGADGRVNEWRIGLPPQVDYVEGCS